MHFGAFLRGALGDSITLQREVKHRLRGVKHMYTRPTANGAVTQRKNKTPDDQTWLILRNPTGMQVATNNTNVIQLLP